MQTDIEKIIYSICVKVQSYTKDKYLHKIAVKIFAKKNKYVLALKSLLLLQRHFPESEEYISSLEIFNQFFKENQAKIKDNVTNILKNYLPVIFNKAEFDSLTKKESEKINGNYNAIKANNPFDKCIFMIKDFTYFAAQQKNLTEVEKAVFDALNCDKTCLRKIVSDKALFVEVFLSVFCSEDSLNKFKVILEIILFLRTSFFFLKKFYLVFEYFYLMFV
jgi:hypothetical protein